MNKSKIRNIVLECYYEDNNVVNDRTALIAAVWRKSGWDDSRSLEENLMRVPSAESITRRLRELHQEGLIEYSSDELERRTEAFKTEQEIHSSHKIIGYKW